MPHAENSRFKNILKMCIFELMLTKSEILNKLSDLKPILHREYSVRQIGLFGSFSNDSYTEDSDIDLLVEFENNVSDLYTIKNKIREEIQNQFNRPVDICREKYIKPIFKEQIISDTIYV